MAKTIAFVNQKGGVGKTTSCVNLAACLQEAGAKVLVCDFDPQGNATSGFGVDKGAVSPTIYDVLISGAAVEHAIVHTKYSDVLPANKGAGRGFGGDDPPGPPGVSAEGRPGPGGGKL